jgi:hypothetical protein
MKSSLCLLAFFAVFLLAGATDVDDSDVVVLNAHNFDAQTAEGIWMIELYALLRPTLRFVLCCYFSTYALAPSSHIQLCAVVRPLQDAQGRHRSSSVSGVVLVVWLGGRCSSPE